MRSFPSLSLSNQPLFVKPTKAAWASSSVSVVLFSLALAALALVFALPVQTTIALLIGGLSVGAADLFGAGAKRVGTLTHVLSVAGLYCGAWLVAFAVDWVLFGHKFMVWMGW